MDKRPIAEVELSSVRECLNLALQEQRAATQELQAGYHELASILEQFLQLRAELRAVAGEFSDGHGASQALETLPPISATREMDLAEIQHESEQVLQVSQQAVRALALLREKSSRVRLALQATANSDGLKSVFPDSVGLSKRERQVLTLIVAGKSSKQIAVDLGISFKTAVTHRASIMSKLDVHEIASVVREALKRGLA